MAIILFIRSPWGQNIIKNKLTSYVSDKTNTVVEIERLFITFDGDVALDGLYLEDKKGDTLLYSGALEADIPLWDLITGNGITIDDVEWSNVRANISRQDTMSGYNFQFLIDALAGDPSQTTPQNEETSSGSTQLTLGDFELEDIKVSYVDEVTNMDMQVDLGSFDLRMSETKLDSMVFVADRVYLNDTDFSFEQTGPMPESNDSTSTPLPRFVVEDFRVKNTNIDYSSTPDNLDFNTDISTLNVQEAQVNLGEMSYKASSLTMNNSDLRLDMTESNDAATDKTTSGEIPWPPIDIDVDRLSLDDYTFEYYLNGAKVSEGNFNPNAIRLSQLQLNATNFVLKDRFVNLDLAHLFLKEGSGISVNQLQFDARLSNKGLDLKGLNARVNSNRLAGSVTMSYPSLEAIMDRPSTVNAALDLNQIKIDLEELYRFQPALQENPYVQTLAKKNITGYVTASGQMDDIQFKEINFNWGGTTRITASGSLQHPTVPDSLSFRLPDVQITTQKSDVLAFVPQDQLSINLPKEIRLQGDIAGTMTKVDADVLLATNEGSITVDASTAFGDQLAFDGKLNVDSLNLGTLLENEKLGKLNLSLTATGSGSTLSDLDAKLDATVEGFTYEDYNINDLTLTGDIKNGQGEIRSDYTDEFLNLNLTAGVELDSITSKIDLSLGVIGANLKGIGLTRRDVRTAFKLDASLEGNTKDYDVDAEIIDGVAVLNNEAYLLGNFDLKAHVEPDTTAVKIQNRILDLTLNSNTDPGGLGAALQNHFERYVTETPQTDTITNPVNLTVSATLSEAPILSEVFLPGITEMDTISINMNFKEKERKLTSSLHAPLIIYAGTTVDSLHAVVDSDKEHLDFELAFKNIQSGPIDIQKTVFDGKVADNVVNLDFISYADAEKLIHIKSKIIQNQEQRYEFSLDTSELIFNRNQWNVNPNNKLVITKTNIEAYDFVLTRQPEGQAGNTKRVELVNNVPNIKGEHIGMELGNWPFQTLFTYLNPDEKLAEGDVNGYFAVEFPFEKPALVADLTVNKFKVMEQDMGKIALNAQSKNGIDYTADMEINGGLIDIDLTGDYRPNPTSAQIDLDLNLNRIDMKAVEAFSLGELQNAQGEITGKIDIDGTIADPQYDGQLNFKEADFLIKKLNAAFTLANERIKINNEAIAMNGFTITDEKKNDLVVSGKIGTENFLNPTFDLTLKADDFHILNSDEDDFDLFYGTASFNADATLTGDLKLPVLKGKLVVKEDTNVSYVLPPQQTQIASMQGVVMFVNKENPDSILTESEEEVYTVSGLDITAKLLINKGAKVSIILNEQTGDQLQVQGNGNLDFGMDASGRMRLNGSYTITDGFYEMSLYNLVKRRFEILEGSKVSWYGDVLGAQLDVKARYDVETSASGLMALQTSSLGSADSQRFRQEAEFYVYLNIDGEILQPKISFGLDMPESERGLAGGEVYGYVQQVNQQEAQLNKQVFSLLVLNKFSASGSDGSGISGANIARDNLNDAISDQLNVFSDKLLGDSGFSLDFGLDSYTDYQGDNPEQRTTLDVAAQKKLLDDRLVVRVGSQVDVEGGNNNANDTETTPLIGNVSIAYLLTKDGRYRLKGFRRNQFENIIDGQLIVNGISLIFTREFNQFDELWRSLFSTKTKIKSSGEE
ncbi:hypothetical protein GCM10009117_09120 [Gangjinia marincola]|uniref:Translocation and assembly module TamB C-terminal domain-containing protein n=1 Tax=Gangjinia marincola TaxID=578463 RepID=A0ABN1MFB7_9FLAO